MSGSGVQSLGLFRVQEEVVISLTGRPNIDSNILFSGPQKRTLVLGKPQLQIGESHEQSYAA